MSSYQRIALYGRPAWSKWLDRASRLAGISNSAFVDLALRSHAERVGLAAPPERLDRFSHRRAARRRAATTPR